jgi:hypothetical protein
MSENTPKKAAKVRTSITISPCTLERVRRICESGAVSVSSYIEDAVLGRMGPEAVVPKERSRQLDLFTSPGEE